jgi:hypothetical protein
MHRNLPGWQRWRRLTARVLIYALFIAGAMAGATISGTRLSADGGGAADWGLRCHRISVRECVVLNREN